MPDDTQNTTPASDDSMVEARAATDLSGWSYRPTQWQDGPSGGTPINAQNLLNLENGMVKLFRTLPQYQVASSTAAAPTTPCLLHVVDQSGAYGGTWLDTGSGTRQCVQTPRPSGSARRAFAYASSYEGIPKEDAGTWTTLQASFITVKDPSGSAAYTVDMGVCADTSQGRYGMRLEIFAPDSSYVNIRHPLLASGTDSVVTTTSRHFAIQNGTYKIVLRGIVYDKPVLRQSGEYAFFDDFATPHAFSRYCFVTSD